MTYTAYTEANQERLWAEWLRLRRGDPTATIGFEHYAVKQYRAEQNQNKERTRHDETINRAVPTAQTG
jgi:hypothetical protein